MNANLSVLASIFCSFCNKEKNNTIWDFVSARRLYKHLKRMRNETRKNNLRGRIPGKWDWKCRWLWFEFPSQLLRFQSDPFWILISKPSILICLDRFWGSFKVQTSNFKPQTTQPIVTCYLLSHEKECFPSKYSL